MREELLKYFFKILSEKSDEFSKKIYSGKTDLRFEDFHF